MAKRVNRVPYSLNKGDVKDLPREETEKILRAADDLIIKGIFAGVGSVLSFFPIVVTSPGGCRRESGLDDYGRLSENRI